MSDNNMLDKALDIMLDEAAANANNQIDEIQCDEDVAFSEEHERKMQQLFRKEKNKIRRRKIARVSKFAAMFVLVLAISAGVAIYKVESWRNSFIDFVFHSEAPNTDFFFGDGSDRYSDENVILHYLPSDFALKEDSTTKGHVCLMFSSEEQNKYFHFFIDPVGMNFSVDTENATIEEFKLKEVYDAIYISNPNVNTLIWDDEEYVYTITGDIDEWQMIQIAENAERLMGK